jgi:lysyl-tRNA synthetase class I
MRFLRSRSLENRAVRQKTSLSDRVNKLPNWARDYIHRVQTFVGAEEVEELTQLRDERRQLIKLIAELKAKNGTAKAT